MNHLQTMHYHLGLVCVDFFSTSADAMRWYTHVCKSITAAEDNDQEEEEYDNDDDGNEDNEYLVEEA